MPSTLQATRNKKGFTGSQSVISAFFLLGIQLAHRESANSYASVLQANMAVRALIDTGAILALVDTSDAWHMPCLATFRQLPLPLLTSEAVLAELFHLIGDHRSRKEDAWRLIRSAAIILSPIVDSELARLHNLMSRYSDRPMDFADATLVYLAERESIQAVFTVDQNDFATYRIGGRRRFQVLPIQRPRFAL